MRLCTTWMVVQVQSKWKEKAAPTLLMRSMTFVVAAITATIFSTAAYAHGGGLDGLGCHHNRKAGGYHCHRGPLAGQYFNSKDEATRALQGSQSKDKPPQLPAPPQQNPPTSPR